MDESIVLIAKESATQILERAAFLFTEEMDPSGIPNSDIFLNRNGFALDYTGPLRGELRIWLTEPLSRVIASNMLGLEDGTEISKHEEADAVKEILNMILGIFLTEAFGTEAVFHLGIPRELDADEWHDSVEAEGHFWIMVEDEPALMSVHGGE